MKKNRTVFAKDETVKRQWYVVDAADKILGRVATRVATYLRGKHKALYTPHVDCGDFVVVINAQKVRVSGKKNKQKTYFTHSGYPHGAKSFTFEKMMEKNPEKVVRLSVEGMLPKNRLGKKMIKKLKIYSGSNHPHQVKNIQKLEV
jgi:large subunit ribosomal protein L13